MSASPNNNSLTSCLCSQILGNSTQSEKGLVCTPKQVNANVLADSLGVSPLYRQQDQARWQSAAQVYESSQTHSPVIENSTHCNYDFSATKNQNNTGFGIECLTPKKLYLNYYQQSSSAINTPISLEDIANVNRKRHQEIGDLHIQETKSGALELEAIAAVHELAFSVKTISVSEILPRTANLIFVNIKTHEDQTYTLELTMKGWRIASTNADSMNGDYSNVELHTRYFDNARELLKTVSPNHSFQFSECLTERLKILEKKKENENH